LILYSANFWNAPGRICGCVARGWWTQTGSSESWGYV